ncbi:MULTISPECIES: DUF4376 domain-containing protein [unclassified Agrobacterium]|uniref:DUF4376 domain-containing protein n=1 Tax=unclassified Agrobacterium TaxID=2632611 RepID=UPI00244C8C08|nr:MULTISPECIES: DUF4376 domain-containing protein [unclassified Agrobacterium]MDH0615939.1 DUF4376 domain-containing protein [Agrobacterium sp. GD03872]MDH0698054.1 DUF4376 domain-containing protein [Agrobacterium sp. GD03871]MDH1061139.1 DUF4376 domain-containing protein [Agrobacterium sp. GD03992]MDH2211829.1 DUF4376 domain-containing protein [Agrobacterium sp. GD03643]MDH2221221.1 DUF4376 domain-containing protein [Agrobacterium sp. GD03638]
MPAFARVDNERVIEVVSLDKGVKISDAFHPDLAAQFKACADGVMPGWVYDGKTFSQPVAESITKSELLAYAAMKRFEIETGGIVVNGCRVDTSRDSQSMIANAHSYVVASGAASTKFKSLSGFVTLSAAEVKETALAVGAHVQSLFDAEATIDALITSGDIASLADIDAYQWRSGD